MQQSELEELKVIGRKLDKIIALFEEAIPLLSGIYERVKINPIPPYRPIAPMDGRSEQTNHATFQGTLKGAMAVCNCREFKSGDKWECPYHGYVR